MKGKTKSTVEGYSKSLRQFAAEAVILVPTEINREKINEWVLALRERKCGTRVIARHLWAIKAFLTWLKEEKHIDCYEFDVEIPRPAPPDYVEYLEPEEIERLASVIDVTTESGLKLHTLIEVMLNTGLRPSEALSLTVSDVESDELEVVGKGGKRRKVYLNDRAREWIDRYLAERTDSEQALFVTRNKVNGELRPLSLRQAQHEFLMHFRKSGIKKRVTLHTLRHTYATTLLINGCPIDYVAMLLGHSRPETTRQHYISLKHKHAKQAHFRYLSYHS